VELTTSGFHLNSTSRFTVYLKWLQMVIIWTFLLLSSYLILQRLIDPVDQPCEGTAIDGFGQGISGIDSVINSERTQNLEIRKTRFDKDFD